MSPRDASVLVLAGIVLVVGAIVAARLQRNAVSRWSSQLVAGLVCGLAASVAVVVPFVDVVPDTEEVAVTVGGAVGLLLAGVGASLVWNGRGRRTRRQPPRR